MYDIPLDSTKLFCMCNYASEESENVCSQCGKNRLSLWKNSILVMLPLMLGVSKIQPDYYDTFKYFLKSKYSVGIIGGKPRSALYIAGCKENSVIVLDPHYVQPASKSLTDLKTQYESYFLKKLITNNIQDLESSMTIGFYFRNQEEFQCFHRSLIEDWEIIKGIICVKDYTPNYALYDLDAIDENEDGFIVLD